jgi:DNA (cytosine-5)-methyltransferase 1
VATASPASYLTALDAAWQAHHAPRAGDAPTVVSLFAGGGGSSLGYRMAGYRELLAVEWDDHAVDTLRLNLPDVPVWAGDIAELPLEECLQLIGLAPGELDVLDGSPPCQGFSTAGKRQLHDARNGLWREYVRILEDLRPRAFVLENVPGLVKGKMRLVFSECYRALQACGYHVSARMLNAACFGVPQDRRRLVILGIREDLSITPTHPRAETWPIPLRVPLGAAHLLRGQLTDAATDPLDWETPALNDAYGQLWERVARGGCAADIIGKGYTNCVKPRLDRPCCTLPKTQTGRGFATVVHPIEPRALSVLEAKLISSFPPQYQLTGSYRERWARIGNAVPPLLIRAIATHLRQTVFELDTVQQQRDVA